MHSNNIEDSRPRYKAICPCCNTELWVCKSIAMEVGIHDIGHGSCLECGSFLHLEFIMEKNEMKATQWDEYMRTKKARENYPPVSPCCSQQEQSNTEAIAKIKEDMLQKLANEMGVPARYLKP